MDSHSGGMSSSNGNINFANIHPHNLPDVVRKSLSSISRPKVHSGPLEHQLAPAIQQGSYRHVPLDRMVNMPGQLVRTKDHTRPHSPSAASSPTLAENLNHNLVEHRVKFPLGDHNTDQVTITDKQFQGEWRAHQQWRAGMIATIVIFFIMLVLVVSFLIWRCRKDRKARGRRDEEAPKVVDERTSAPQDDPYTRRPDPIIHKGGSFSFKAGLSAFVSPESRKPRQLSSLTPEDPFADPQNPFVDPKDSTPGRPGSRNEAGSRTDLHTTINDAEQQWRGDSNFSRRSSIGDQSNPFLDPPTFQHEPVPRSSLDTGSLKPAALFNHLKCLRYDTVSIFSRGNNPSKDSNDSAEAEGQELSEKVDDGCGGQWRTPQESHSKSSASATAPTTRFRISNMYVTKAGKRIALSQRSAIPLPKSKSKNGRLPKATSEVPSRIARAVAVDAKLHHAFNKTLDWEEHEKWIAERRDKESARMKGGSSGNSLAESGSGSGESGKGEKR